MFEVNIFDYTLLGSGLICFVAGLLSFLSPCILPIVPPYLAFMAGSTIDEIRNSKNSGREKLLIFTALSFTLGLSTVFILLSLVANSLGSVFLSYKNEIRYFSGILIILFGIHFLGLFRLRILEKEWRLDGRAKNSRKNIAAYVLGLTFAFGWTPCIGPILGSILAIIAQEDSLFRGIFLMVFYSMGLSIPFIVVAALLGRGMVVTKFLSKYFFAIEKVIGVFLILIGASFLHGSFQYIGFFLLEVFPALNVFG